MTDLKARATPDEWMPQPQPVENLPRRVQREMALGYARTDEELVGDINAALANGDTVSALVKLGEIARLHGMSVVAKGKDRAWRGKACTVRLKVRQS